jgi:hypothetical protein
VERQPVIENVIAPPSKSIDATTAAVDQEVDATPLTVDSDIQSTPTLVDRLIEAKPDILSVFVEAAPVVVEQSAGTQIEPEIQSEVKETIWSTRICATMNSLAILSPYRPSSGVISSACKTFFLLPLYVPAHILT